MIKGPLLRFLAIGVSNAIIGFAVFRVVFAWSGVAVLSQALSYGSGIAWSFVLNRNWTFEMNGPQSGAAVRFTLLQLTLLACTSSAIGLAVDIYRVPPTAAWIGVMAVATIVNYLVSKHWVFTPR